MNSQLIGWIEIDREVSAAALTESRQSSRFSYPERDSKLLARHTRFEGTSWDECLPANRMALLAELQAEFDGLQRRFGR